MNELTDYDNNKIVENISCKYLKDNIKYVDIIYIILTNNMEKIYLIIKYIQSFWIVLIK